ncbi:MAG TPA: methyltransferase domain-containing protein [Candidatus Solibacter sp.]|nr:methyltransferase domain-containing protein [Candidatus Solibacter sp.]
MSAPNATHDKVTDVKACYDLIAEEYARRIYAELENKPFDRAVLDRFAASVVNMGIVCDLGCGPGHIARYLHDHGVTVCGVDLSTGMLQCARRLNPTIEFRQGDMRSLPVRDNSWAGIAAFYAIVNLAPNDILKAFREMTRTLMPGGRLLVSFHIGDNSSHREEDLWGTGACFEIMFFRVGTITGFMESAGLEIDEVVEREPYGPDVEFQSRRVYVFAHKPQMKAT